MISERLQNAIEKLPRGLAPKLAPITSGLGEIVFYVVDYAPGATNKPATRREQLMELEVVHDYVIKPMLRSVPGLADVNGSGGYEKQIVVLPKPEKLARPGLRFSELAKVLGENTENAGGGVVNQGKEQLIIRTVGRVQTTEEIGNLPVKFGARGETDPGEGRGGSGNWREGANRRRDAEWRGSVARDGADVERRKQPDCGQAGGGKDWGNSTEAAAGIVMETVYDRSTLVERTIATVGRNLFEGAVLVVVVLLALMGSWRAALIVAAAIPLSLLFAMTGMVEGRISGNLMSLGAIDFGLIIDGAVVIVENIVRSLGLRQHQLGRKLTREERLHVVAAASKEVASPMFFGVVIITIVYFPILSLTGIEGKMFHPMAVTVMLCLGSALVLALTLMPVLCSFLLRGQVERGGQLRDPVRRRQFTAAC